MKNSFVNQIAQMAGLDKLLSQTDSGIHATYVDACAGSQPFLSALLHHHLANRCMLVVTEGLRKQELFQQDLDTWLGLFGNPGYENGQSASDVWNSQRVSTTKKSFFYPAWEGLPNEEKLPHVDVISERLETLIALSGKLDSQSPPIIVTDIIALLQKTFSPESIRKRSRVLRRGDPCDPLDLVEWLEEQGYESEAQVTQKCEIALKGGIVDVYPPASPWPVRLEFFGDELESLRFFDPYTQVSREEINEVLISPGGEWGFLRKAAEQPTANHQPDASLRDQFSSLAEHLPNGSIVVLCERDLLTQQMERYLAQSTAENPYFTSWQTFQNILHQKNITQVEFTELMAMSGSLENENRDISPDQDSNVTETSPAPNESSSAAFTQPELRKSGTISMGFHSLAFYPSSAGKIRDPQIIERQRRELFTQIHRWLRQGYNVCVTCNNDGERLRFAEIWREYGLENSDSIQPTVLIAALTQGFQFDPGRCVVITDAEIFGRYKVPRPRRLKSPHAAAIRSQLDIDFTDFEEGDYVVHIQHGIGRYLGLQIMPSSKKLAARASSDNQECLVIEYAPGAPGQALPRLYVPVTEAHLVSKYVGAGKARPQLNTLGGSRWAKAKVHAEHAIRDLAGELLSIQAARASQPGHSCGTDTAWQREFESAFFYEETPDQLRAIQETKADQESTKPMDRLICGDVGFGKTEVALRAAFKMVMDGRQVAILAPTTVLAQQHYNTFQERMADYPIRIDLLSRFRRRGEQKKVLENLALGSVDIVIGTHRLVQADVRFKDLGLVIIDEEQRFGVMHKERLKKLRHLVDVLTLSATPIPRTLYLALTGARDMSTIETPPQDRLPVETIVVSYDERVIRDAIRRELNRQGQVFFLHNRVSTIDAVAQRIKSLVPEARLVVGHGQMDSDELEDIMAQFINGEADVLVSTTIIESGLDIPNANTIIIDRADRFGLSDLYQLRGRVGRYKHQAYAYLLLPRHAALLNDARKRLSAIKQYSSLGSGFKIAMRDLELRGAGNLLGAEQSGHITAVGFELYCQLLKQSISVLKGEPVKPRVETQASFDFLISQENELPKPLPRSVSENTEEIYIPRDVAVYLSTSGEREDFEEAEETPITPDHYGIPVSYIEDDRQRVELYRKLAQATDVEELERIHQEAEDRFGPLPQPLELLLLVYEIKIIAPLKQITGIQTKGSKLMLQRQKEYLMINGRFPRLKNTTAKSCLQEIKRQITALPDV